MTEEKGREGKWANFVAVLEVRGRDGGDVWEAFEVARVEGQYLRDAVDRHDGDRSRIVNEDAFNGVSHDQPSPFLM